MVGDTPRMAEIVSTLPGEWRQHYSGPELWVLFQLHHQDSSFSETVNKQAMSPWLIQLTKLSWKLMLLLPLCRWWEHQQQKGFHSGTTFKGSLLLPLTQDVTRTLEG